MKDSRLISFIEVLVNVASGFLLAMFIWQFIIPFAYPHLEPTLEENFKMTTVFTVASVLRGYLWRRFFANGFHQTLVEWVAKLK
jgi:hypothetical protein